MSAPVGGNARVVELLVGSGVRRAGLEEASGPVAENPATLCNHCSGVFSKTPRILCRSIWPRRPLHLSKRLCQCRTHPFALRFPCHLSPIWPVSQDLGYCPISVSIQHSHLLNPVEQNSVQRRRSDIRARRAQSP